MSFQGRSGRVAPDDPATAAGSFRGEQGLGKRLAWAAAEDGKGQGRSANPPAPVGVRVVDPTEGVDPNVANKDNGKQRAPAHSGSTSWFSWLGGGGKRATPVTSAAPPGAWGDKHAAAMRAAYAAGTMAATARRRNRHAPDAAAAAAQGKRGTRMKVQTDDELSIQEKAYRLWEKGKAMEGPQGWLLRRGLPALASVLFVWDVVSDGLLAKDLYTNGYDQLGGIVVACMFGHYIPTYLMMLRAVNQMFYTSRVMVLSNNNVDPAALASLETQHAYYYAILVVLGIPLMPFIDVYMVLTNLVLIAETGEGGYVMRAAEDFCRQYERVRLPLECFLESMPQTALQVYLYIQTRTGSAAEAVQVSQTLLTFSLLGSVLNLANVLWEMYNAWRASGDTLLEYLDALIRLQGSTKVPMEVQLALLQRTDEAKRRVKDHEREVRGTAGGGEDGEDEQRPAASGAVDGEVPLEALAKAKHRQPLLHSLPPNLVFGLGGAQDRLYQALSPFQRRCLMDLLCNPNKVQLHELVGLQLLGVDAKVAGRLFRRMVTLPAHLRIVGMWRKEVLTSGRNYERYVSAVTRYLPEALWEADTRSPLLELELSHMALTGVPGAAGLSVAGKSTGVAYTDSLAVGRAFGRMLEAQPQLKRLVVEECDVDVLALLEGVDQWKEETSIFDKRRGHRRGSTGQDSSDSSDDEGRIPAGRGAVAEATEDGALPGAPSGHWGALQVVNRAAAVARRQHQGPNRQCLMVFVHPFAGGKLDAGLEQRANRRRTTTAAAAGAGAGASVHAAGAAGVAPRAAGALKPDQSFALGAGRTTSGQDSPLRELHLLPGYRGRTVQVDAEVMLVPCPTAPGLLSLMLEALSCVLAPSQLVLSNTVLTVEDVVSLSAVLSFNTSLQTLDLRSTGLSTDSAPLLVQGLHGHTALTSIDLSYNGIGDNGSVALAGAIQDLPDLKALLLATCQIGSRGADALAGGLLSRGVVTQLQALELQDNKEECSTAALEWVAFLFQNYSGKVCKTAPVHKLEVEGYAPIPAFVPAGCDTYTACKALLAAPLGTDARAGLNAVRKAGAEGAAKSPAAAELALPSSATGDIGRLVLVAATAASARKAVALKLAGWAPRPSKATPAAKKDGDKEGEQEEQEDTNPRLSAALPGFMYPGGAGALLASVAGGVLALDCSYLHELDLSGNDLAALPQGVAEASRARPTTARPGKAPAAGVHGGAASGGTLSPMEHVRRGLVGNGSLKVLRLVGCGLDDLAVVQLCRALADGSCPTLTRLELHGNEDVKDRGVCDGVVPLLRAAQANRASQDAQGSGVGSSGTGAAATISQALCVTIGVGDVAVAVASPAEGAATEPGWSLQQATVTTLISGAAAKWGAQYAAAPSPAAAAGPAPDSSAAPLLEAVSGQADVDRYVGALRSRLDKAVKETAKAAEEFKAAEAAVKAAAEAAAKAAAEAAALAEMQGKADAEGGEGGHEGEELDNEGENYWGLEGDAEDDAAALEAMLHHMQPGQPGGLALGKPQRGRGRGVGARGGRGPGGAMGGGPAGMRFAGGRGPRGLSAGKRAPEPPPPAPKLRVVPREDLALAVKSDNQAVVLACAVAQLPASWCSMLGRLDLSGSAFGAPGMYALSLALTHLAPHVEELVLAGLVDGPGGDELVQEVAGLVRKLPRLRLLDVSGKTRPLGTAAAVSLLQAVCERDDAPGAGKGRRSGSGAAAAGKAQGQGEAHKPGQPQRTIALGPVEPSAELIPQIARLVGMSAAGDAPGGDADSEWNIDIRSGDAAADAACHKLLQQYGAVAVAARRREAVAAAAAAAAAKAEAAAKAALELAEKSKAEGDAKRASEGTSPGECTAEEKTDSGEAKAAESKGEESAAGTGQETSPPAGAAAPPTPPAGAAGAAACEGVRSSAVLKPPPEPVTIMMQLKNDRQAFALAAALCQLVGEEGHYFARLDLTGSAFGGTGLRAVCAAVLINPALRQLEEVGLAGVADAVKGEELVPEVERLVAELPHLHALDLTGRGAVLEAEAVRRLLECVAGAGAAGRQAGGQGAGAPAAARPHTGPRLLRVGPVAPSGPLLRQLAALAVSSGAALQQQATRGLLAAAAGAAEPPGPWLVHVQCGDGAVDAVCRGMLHAARSPLAQLLEHRAGGSAPPAAAAGGEAAPAAKPAAAAGKPNRLPKASALKPEHQAALLTAMCQGLVALNRVAAVSTPNGRGASRTSTPNGGGEAAAGAAPLVAVLRAAAASVAAGGQDDVQQQRPDQQAGVEGAAALDAVQAILEATGVVAGQTASAAEAGEAAAAPALDAADGAAGGGAGAARGRLVLGAPQVPAVRVDPRQLAEGDAAALVLALVPGDLVQQHDLEFSGCALSPEGTRVLLQLLALHGSTLTHLGLMGHKELAPTPALQQQLYLNTLPALRHLQQLNLRNCGLSAQALGGALRGCEALQRVFVDSAAMAKELKDTGLLPEGAKCASGTSKHIPGNLLSGHTNSIWTAQFSPDGTRLASTAEDGMIIVWDTKLGTQITSFKSRDTEHIGMIWGPHNDRIYGGCKDGTLVSYDAATGNQAATGSGHSNQLNTLVVTPDDTKLITGAWDSQIKVWDIPQGHTGSMTCLHTMTGNHGHKDVMCISITADGTRLVSGARDGSIAVWDLTCWACIKSFTSGGVYTSNDSQCLRRLACSPLDPDLFAVAGNDFMVRVWSIASGKNTDTFAGHTKGVGRIAFHPGGAFVATGSNPEDGTARLWHMATKACACTLEGPEGKEVRSVSFSRSGDRLAVCEQKRIWVWDCDALLDLVQQGTSAPGGTIATLTCRQAAQEQGSVVLAGHTRPARCVAWTQDGKWLASGGKDNAVRLWDVSNEDDPKCVATMDGHSDWVNGIAVTSDGAYIVSGSDDRTLRIWDVAQRKLVAKLEGHTDYVRWLTLDNTGAKQIASSSSDQTIRLWDVKVAVATPEKACTATLKGHTNKVLQVAYSPDNTKLASASWDKTVKIWNLTDNNACEATLDGTSSFYCCAWSPDGELVVAGDEQMCVRVYKVATKELLRSLTGHTYQIWSVCFSPDGSRVLSTSSNHDSDSKDHMVRVFDPRTGRLAGSFAATKGTSAAALKMAFNAEGTRLAAGCADNQVRIWKTEDLAHLLGGPEKEPKDKSVETWNARMSYDYAIVTATPPLKHGEWVWSIAWFSDGKQLATVSKDKKIRIWDATTWEVKQELPVDDDAWKTSIDVSPCGRWLATGSGREAAAVWVWDLHASPPTKRKFAGHNGQVFGVSFSFDSKFVASSGDDKEVRIWEVDGGTCIATCKGHDKTTRACKFRPGDNKTVVSGSDDGDVRIWTADGGGQCLHTLKGHTGAVYSATWSADGNGIVSAGGKECKARVWVLADGKWTNRVTLEGHSDTCTGTVFSPDGKFVVSTGGGTKKAFLWEADTGKQLALLTGHKETVWCAQFRPDGQQLVTHSFDSTCMVWDVGGILAASTL